MNAARRVNCVSEFVCRFRDLSCVGYETCGIGMEILLTACESLTMPLCALLHLFHVEPLSKFMPVTMIRSLKEKERAMHTWATAVLPFSTCHMRICAAGQVDPVFSASTAVTEPKDS